MMALRSVTRGLFSSNDTVSVSVLPASSGHDSEPLPYNGRETLPRRLSLMRISVFNGRLGIPPLLALSLMLTLLGGLEKVRLSLNLPLPHSSRPLSNCPGLTSRHTPLPVAPPFESGGACIVSKKAHIAGNDDFFRHCFLHEDCYESGLLLEFGRWDSARTAGLVLLSCRDLWSSLETPRPIKHFGDIEGHLRRLRLSSLILCVGPCTFGDVAFLLCLSYPSLTALLWPQCIGPRLILSVATDFMPCRTPLSLWAFFLVSPPNYCKQRLRSTRTHCPESESDVCMYVSMYVGM